MVKTSSICPGIPGDALLTRQQFVARVLKFAANHKVKIKTIKSKN